MQLEFSIWQALAGSTHGNDEATKYRPVPAHLDFFFWTKLSISIQVEQEVLSCDFCQNEILERF